MALSEDEAAEARLRPALLVGSLLFVLLRLPLALRDHGLFWPDEIHQTLEQAHRLVFGYGLIPWEFRDGARSWLIPGALAGIWKVAVAFGVSQAESLVVVAKLAVVGLGLLGQRAGIRLANRLGGEAAAWLAGAWLASFPGLLVWGARVMSESITAPLVLMATWMLWSPSEKKRDRLAGALLALATLLRFQNGLLAAALWLGLLWKERARARPVLEGAVPMTLAGLALDWATWGSPIHTIKTYVVFNLVEGKGAQWGTSPFQWYATTFVSGIGLPGALLVAALLGALWLAKTRWMVLLGIPFVLLHCWVAHKEFRFLIPLWPLLLVAASVALAEALRWCEAERWSAVALAGGLLLVGIGQTGRVTFAELGQYTEGSHGQRSPFHAEEDISLLLARAGRLPELCGLVQAGTHPAWSGGYTYLHRDVPMWFRPMPGDEQRANVWLLASEQGPAGYERIDHEGRFTLFRRPGGCSGPPPGYDRSLP